MAEEYADIQDRSDFSSDSHVHAVAAKAYVRIAAAWKLRNEESAALIDVSSRTWSRMKSEGWSGRLSKDQLMRISALTGLYKALNLYFDSHLTDKWVRLNNAGGLFMGKTPLEKMVEGGLPAIMETRDYVDALRGGA